MGESCITKSVMSFVMGGGMGFAFGMLFSSTGYQEVDHTLSTRKQLIVHYKAAFRNALVMGKNFAWVGLVFAGTECLIEKARGKSDMWNNMSAACLSGAVLAAGGGPQAAAFGCVGFV